MEENEWKDIVDDLTEQNTRLSIERAVARADVKKHLRALGESNSQIKDLTEELERINSADVQVITTKE